MIAATVARLHGGHWGHPARPQVVPGGRWSSRRSAFSVGFLRAGTGGTALVFTSVMALPVIPLGVEPDRLPMLRGGPVTVVALWPPVIHDPDTLDNGKWSRVIYVPIIMG